MCLSRQCVLLGMEWMDVYVCVFNCVRLHVDPLHVQMSVSNTQNMLFPVNSAADFLHFVIILVCFFCFKIHLSVKQLS